MQAVIQASRPVGRQAVIHAGRQEDRQPDRQPFRQAASYAGRLAHIHTGKEAVSHTGRQTDIPPPIYGRGFAIYRVRDLLPHWHADK